MAMVCQSGDGASMGRAHMQARTSSGRTFKLSFKFGLLVSHRPTLTLTSQGTVD